MHGGERGGRLVGEAICGEESGEMKRSVGETIVSEPLAESGELGVGVVDGGDYQVGNL